MIGVEAGAIPTFLTQLPRWLLWREVIRAGKRTKIPLTTAFRAATSTDPATWADFNTVTGVLKLGLTANFSGIGIVLGDLGTGERIGGIDLDSCLDEHGNLATWAAPIVAALGTYGEVSPNAHGLKFFFRSLAADADVVHSAFGIAPGKWGRKCSVPAAANGREHGPAIETYLGGRFFCTTGKRWADAPADVVLLDRDTLQKIAALIREATAAPSGKQGNKARSGRDTTRSAAAFRLGLLMHRRGTTFDEMCAAIREHPDTAAWCREKGDTNDGRELRNIWSKAEQAARGRPGDDATFDVPIEFSENALAHLFSDQHADTLIHVHEWGQWLRWDAGRWREDHAVTVFDAARKICAEQGNVARAVLANSGTKVAATINRAACVAAIERLARHHHRHVEPSVVFDVDPALLNGLTTTCDVHNATVSIREQRREDYCTRATTVDADLTTDCPLWKAFLLRIMNDSHDMVAYLQRLCGYMLTGFVNEHVLFFAHGTGANGKSTFAKVLLGILGTGASGYAAVAPISLFTASRTDQHPTELAMLRGIRCVIAYETEQGRSWAIAKLKMMTGDDKITARFMRQDFFSYDPQFKILILGNHKPALRHVDEATRRRFHLIPFTVTIPEAKRDTDLGNKLRAEYPAILSWMIQGRSEWQKHGLNPPDAILAATKSYLANEDNVGTWITERCDLGPQHYATLVELFASWKDWSEANGEHPGPRKQLAKLLDAREELERHEQPRTGRAGWFGIIVR